MMTYARRISEALLAPLETAHGPERRSLPWWSIFTIQFWFAPWVASWAGVSLTRVVIGSGIVRLLQDNPVNTPEALLWFGLLIASMAKNSRDLRLGFGSVLGRRADELREAAADSRDAAQAVVDKVNDPLVPPGGASGG